jgi:SAM-dependent methyltransferase
LNTIESDPSSDQEQLSAAQSHPHDVWADGAAYERYVGRWSRLVAREFLAWLASAPGSRWLDVGCGTGALSQTILQCADPTAVQGLDRATGYVACAREQVRDARVRFDVGDAHALPVDTATCDIVVSGLILNFLPQPHVAVSEMIRAARVGGTVAAYVWDYAGKMQLMRHFWNAAVAVNPQAFDLDEGRRFPLCQPQPLADLFRTAGLNAVEVRAIDIATDFHDFDDYWSPFLGGQGPAPSYAMSLSEEQRVELRERLRRGLPFALDGSIPLVARAWAVRGVRGV